MTDISSRFENNLRKVSGVAVAAISAQLSVSGNRLNQAPEYIVGTEEYISYVLPADVIAGKFHLVCTEPFDAATTVTVTTISDVALFTDVPVNALTNVVSAEVDTYFDAVDGFKIVFNQAVTTGKLRVAADYLSLKTNEGIYIDLGA